MKKTNTIGIVSIDAFIDYPLFHQELNDHRKRISPVVNELFCLLIDEPRDTLTHEDILEVLNDDINIQQFIISQGSPDVVESRIVSSIGEYFYHIEKELGSLKKLPDCDILMFAGSIGKFKLESIMHFTKIDITKGQWF